MGYITVHAAQDNRGVDSVGPGTEARVRSYRRTLQYVVVRGCARNYRRQTDGQASFISLRLSSESIAELQCRCVVSPNRTVMFGFVPTIVHNSKYQKVVTPDCWLPERVTRHASVRTKTPQHYAKEPTAPILLVDLRSLREKGTPIEFGVTSASRTTTPSG